METQHVYKITRNNKRFNNKRYNSYEEARNYVRKLIRSWKNAEWVCRNANLATNNIPLNIGGFSIKRVAA